MSSKTIIRAPHDRENPYFMHRRATAQDRNLTWEARGMLSYLLSKPDDWEVNIDDLKQNCGRDKVYAILRELCEAGYVERTPKRDKLGKVDGMIYQVHEYPLPEKPDTDQPDTANPTQHNKDKNKKQNSSSRAEARGSDKPQKTKTPKSRKPNPYFDAIKQAWPEAQKGFILSLSAMLRGTATRGAWKDCALEQPATPEEIIDFGSYAQQRMQDKNLTEMPTVPETIERWFGDFRRWQQEQEAAEAVDEELESDPELQELSQQTADAGDFHVYDDDGTWIGIGQEAQQELFRRRKSREPVGETS